MADLTKEEIYREYHGKVYGYILSKINNVQSSEDLSSDVFVKIYDKLDKFDESKASLSTWIYIITRNTLTDYYRTRKVFAEIPKNLANDSAVEDDICNGEMLDTLADALKTLDKRERDIIILHYYSGMTLKEIADRMAISYSYVKVLRSKALESIKKHFDER